MGTPAKRLILAVGFVLGVSLVAGCGSDAVAPVPDEPITVEESADSDILRLTLSESAARRLDIQTAVVGAADDRMVVPSAAVIIDPEGIYWVYTNPEPLVYLRQEIRPVVEEGQQAFFVDGPPLGTPVVMTGVPELYGAEFGIGK